MIQLRSKLRAMDNSGGRRVRCIKPLKGYNGLVAGLGDYILISVETLRFIRKVKKKQLYLGLITRTKKKKQYKDGSSSKFSLNQLVILNKNKKFLGTRLYGLISKNLRAKKFLRLILMAGKII